MKRRHENGFCVGVFSMSSVMMMLMLMLKLVPQKLSGCTCVHIR